MPESIPEPTLEIFGEQTVSYTRILGFDEQSGNKYASETVVVRVDEIDTIEDPAMRHALWSKYRVQADPKARHIRTVTAHPDGRFKATAEVRKKPLCLIQNEADGIGTIKEETAVVLGPAQRGFLNRLLFR
jgi:hypothetical protein